MAIFFILLGAVTLFSWQVVAPGWKAITLLMVSILSVAGFGISIGVDSRVVAWSNGIVLLIGLFKEIRRLYKRPDSQ